MSVNWNIYKKRLNTNGSTARERQIERAKNNIEKHVIHNPSCKDVLLNGEPAQLVINTGTKPYYKEFETLPGSTIKPGDYVEFANKMWIVMDADFDDELYIDGSLYLCNHKIRWQKTNGKIVERWAYMANASKYNVGESGNATITMATDSFLLFMKIDEEIYDVDRGLKIFLDYNRKNPTVYELTRPEGLTYGYEDLETGVFCGCTNFIVQEKEYSPTQDELDNWIVGWKDIPTSPDNPNQSTILSGKIIYKGSNVITAGGNAKLLSTELTDKSGNILKDPEFTWNTSIIDEFKAFLICEHIGENRFKIRLDYDDLLAGNYIKVFITDSVGNEITSEIFEIGGIL